MSMNIVDIVISEDNRKEFIKKYRDVYTRANTHVYKCSSDILVSTTSNPDSGPETQIPQKTDPRFMSKRFRAAVRKCLEHIGEVSNHGNFRKWDGLIDWLALARFIDRPTRLALHHTLDRSGTVIEIIGRPVVLAEEIVACSESEAAKILKKESKVFIRWWEITRFDCGQAVMESLKGDG